jgi:hypothetical protein
VGAGEVAGFAEPATGCEGATCAVGAGEVAGFAEPATGCGGATCAVGTGEVAGFAEPATGCEGATCDVGFWTCDMGLPQHIGTPSGAVLRDRPWDLFTTHVYTKLAISLSFALCCSMYFAVFLCTFSMSGVI